MSAGSASSTPVPRVRRFSALSSWILAILASCLLIGWQLSKVPDAVAEAAARAHIARSAREGLSVLTLNNRAWRLATDPDPARRDVAEALRLAEEAVKAQPDNAVYLNTLGVAQYRAGNLQAAIETLDGSTRIRGPNAESGFFLAMAHARLGHHDMARENYRTADQSSREAKPGSELSRFREEAAAIVAAFDGAAPDKASAEAASAKPGATQTVPGPKPSAKAD